MVSADARQIDGRIGRLDRVRNDRLKVEQLAIDRRLDRRAQWALWTARRRSLDDIRALALRPRARVPRLLRLATDLEIRRQPGRERREARLR